MDSIADAIVYAVAYIACRDDDEDSIRENESAISHIMAYLSHATTEEKDALAAAAERALQEEKSLHYPEQDMIDFFENWMRIMFGLDWEGNRRA